MFCRDNIEQIICLCKYNYRNTEAIKAKLFHIRRAFKPQIAPTIREMSCEISVKLPISVFSALLSTFSTLPLLRTHAAGDRRVQQSVKSFKNPAQKYFYCA